MDEGKNQSAPARSRRWQAVGVAAVCGLLVGGLSLSGGAAGAVVSTWYSPTLNVLSNDVTNTAWSSTGPTNADYTAVEYGLDDEGFVHLRGQLTADDVEVFQPAGGGTVGPWVGVPFVLPCDRVPPGRITVPIFVVDQDFSTGRDGVLTIEPDGTAVVGAWDLPHTTDVDHEVASFFASLESVTYEAADIC